MTWVAPYPRRPDPSDRRRYQHRATGVVYFITEQARSFDGPVYLAAVDDDGPPISTTNDRLHVDFVANEPTGAPMNQYVPPRFSLYRTSGAADAMGTIPQSQTVSEDARTVQRQLLGIGFTVGPQGADGRPWVNTGNGIQSFARWYNALPEGPPPSNADIIAGRNLTRGPLLTVDRAITAEKRAALARFAARASDQLTPYQQINTTIQQPVAEGFPFLAAGALAVGGLTLIAFLSYVSNRPSRPKASS